MAELGASILYITHPWRSVPLAMGKDGVRRTRGAQADPSVRAKPSLAVLPGSKVRGWSGVLHGLRCPGHMGVHIWARTCMYKHLLTRTRVHVCTPVNPLPGSQQCLSSHALRDEGPPCF